MARAARAFVRSAFLSAVLCLVIPAVADANPKAEFLSPLPGSSMALPETNIIIRPGGVVDAIPGDGLVEVIGSVSGFHAGRLRLSDDHRTLTFRPDLPFTPSEVVTCRIAGALAADGVPGEFSFTIAGPEREGLRDYQAPADEDEVPSTGSGPEATTLQATVPDAGVADSAGADTLPFDFPAIRAQVFGTPAPGRLFVTDVHFKVRGPPIPSYLMILENDGTPYFYRQLDGLGLDFKVQLGRRLTYFNASSHAYYAMNARYDVVDSFRCGNGYSTDNHDLVLLPNGHSLLMGTDPEPVDLSAVGGRADAIVIGLIVQELDQAKNVVFQWRSWDHFQVTDMVYHDITAPVVDYVHGNSLDVDRDGNILLSSRHMNEVTKISRSTGEILWRLGGRNNQFTFLNEPLAYWGQPFVFSHQHDVKVLPDGHLTMFDNGNARVPNFSRAVEWAIDETAMTATRVWEFRMAPDVYGSAFGSVQRLPNGNTLIGWGATLPTLTEVTSQGQIVAQLSFDPGVASYRSLRFEWPPVEPATVAFSPSTINLDPGTGMDAGNESTIRAIIQPDSEDFALSDVDLATIRLDGTIPGDIDRARLDRASLSVPFSREEVESRLSAGKNLLDVSGSLRTGELFRGYGELQVGAGTGQAPPRLVSAPGRLPVELRAIAAGPRRITLAAYDVRGRLMRRLPVNGTGRIVWRGRDRNGRPVPSGIYFVRLEGGVTGPAAKISIVR